VGLADREHVERLADEIFIIDRSGRISALITVFGLAARPEDVYCDATLIPRVRLRGIAIDHKRVKRLTLRRQLELRLGLNSRILRPASRSGALCYTSRPDALVGTRRLGAHTMRG